MNAIKLHILILLLLGFTACSDDGTENETKVLSLDKTSLTMKKGEDTQAVLVTGGGDWEATVPKEDKWCSVMKMSETKLVVMVEANEGPDYRKTSVTVASGEQSFSIAVEQIGEINYTLEKDENLLFNATGDTLKVVISANCIWEYTIDEDWCHAVREADTLRIYADTTVLTDYRTTDIHIAMNGEADYLSFNAKQVPYIDPELSVEPAEAIWASLGETYTLKVHSKLPWTFKANSEKVDCKRIDDETLEVTITNGTMDIFYIYVYSGELEYAHWGYYTFYVGFNQ